MRVGIPGRDHRNTHLCWSNLPYAAFLFLSAAQAVHFELRDELLYPIDAIRAHDLDLLDAHGGLIRRGQPVIIGCENVRPFLDKYADADCTLSTSTKVTLMTAIEGGELPPAQWFIGKKPMQVEKYLPERPVFRPAIDSPRR